MEHSKPQTAIQAAFAPYHVIERRLRRALEENHPIGIGGLYALPDIAKVARDKQHVRDIVAAYTNKKMVIKREIPDAPKNGDRVAFMWNPEYTGEGYRPSLKNIKRSKKPSKPVIITGDMTETKSVVSKRPKKYKTKAIPNFKDIPEFNQSFGGIELEFQGTKITISSGANITITKNEQTGNIKLIIE